MQCRVYAGGGNRQQISFIIIDFILIAIHL